MAGSDVRIRLTPEGVAEVQAALRAVQREARRANTETARGIGSLRKNLLTIRGTLAGLGTGASAVALTGLGRNALQFADAMDEANQRTGVATETLSSIAFAAKLAGTNFETVERSLIRLPQTLDALRDGSAAAVDAFAELQLTAEDFDGLGLDQSFALIAERLARLPSSTAKARVAVDIFGKSAGELIPLLEDIANRGLAGLQRSAQETGAVVSAEFAALAGDTGDAFDVMGIQLQGITTQFLTGFLPVVLDVFDQTDRAMTEDGAQSLRVYGALTARVLTGVTAFWLALGRVIFNVADSVRVVGLSVLRSTFALLTLDVEAFNKAGEQGAADLRQNFEDVVDAVENAREKINAAINGPPASRAGGRPQQGPPLLDPGETEAELRKQQSELQQAEAARLALVKQGLADEATVRSAAASRQASADERAYADGLISLDEYLSRRLAAINSAAAAEIDALNAEIRELESQSAGEPSTQAAAIASLRAQITAREIAAAQAVDEITATGDQRRQEAATTRLEIEQQLAELEGRKQEAARLALELQATALREQLTLAGATAAQVDAAVGRFRAANEARIGFEAIVAEAEAALGELDAARTRIEQDVELGISTQLGAQNRLLQIERARLPVLQALADSLRAAAAASGNPQLIAEAEALSLRVREIGISVELASSSFARFRDQAEQSAVGSLTDFLDNGITQARSLKDAFRQMALSVISDLKRIAAQALATSIVRGLSGAFGGGATGAASGGFFDRGGLLRGPGTSTSDSIPAWLSRGEYVVRAASVRRPGMLQMLEAINSGSALGFARGGIVDIMPRFRDGGPVAATGGAAMFTGRLEVGLADGLESRSTPVSDGLIIDVIRRNPRRIGELLR